MDPIPVPPTEGNPFDDPEADDACNEITVLVQVRLRPELLTEARRR